MNISEGGIQRVGECHCGALKVITAGRTRAGLSVPLQGMPAPHRHCFSFRRHVPTLACAARGPIQDLPAGCRQRITDPVLFLSELRQQFTLGKRARPDVVRGGRRRARQLRSPAELGNFRGVDASLVRTTERDRTPHPGTVAGYELSTARALFSWARLPIPCTQG